MGGIRRQRKKIVTPGHPYDKARLQRELPLVGEYGLRNKRELWKARTILSKARQQARALLALPENVRKTRAEELLSKLSRFGMLQKGNDLDSVLALDVRVVLERRLQTIVHNKGLAGSPHQARQFIVHRHIAINNCIVTSPGRLITTEEEIIIDYAPRSSLQKESHPARPSAPPTQVDLTVEQEKGDIKPEPESTKEVAKSDTTRAEPLKTKRGRTPDQSRRPSKTPPSKVSPKAGATRSLQVDKSIPKPKPKVESKPKPKVESKPKPKVESKPEPKVESKPEPKVESKSKTDTKTEDGDKK